MPEAVVDANILLRYLTGEPRELAERAACILEATERRSMRLIVASLTMAEVVYVLDSVYGLGRQEIAERLLDLIASDVIQVLEREIVSQALVWYRDIGGVHFADAYIAALAAAREHRAVISFDRELRRVPGTRLIQDDANLGPA